MKDGSICATAHVQSAFVKKAHRSTVWVRVPEFKGNCGYFDSWELKSRCQGTSQYNPFWRAIYCIKTEGCGNGKGLKKEAVKTRLLGTDETAAGGKCDQNPYLNTRSEPKCKRGLGALFCEVAGRKAAR